MNTAMHGIQQLDHQSRLMKHWKAVTVSYWSWQSMKYLEVLMLLTQASVLQRPESNKVNS